MHCVHTNAMAGNGYTSSIKMICVPMHLLPVIYSSWFGVVDLKADGSVLKLSAPFVDSLVSLLLSSSGDIQGSRCSCTAAIPLTSGVAMDVPLRNLVHVVQVWSAARIRLPGAKISTHGP